MQKLDFDLEHLILTIQEIRETDHESAIRCVEAFLVSVMDKLRKTVEITVENKPVLLRDARHRLRHYRRGVGQYHGKRKALEGLVDAFEITANIAEIERSDLALSGSVRHFNIASYDAALADDYDFQRDMVELFLVKGELIRGLARRFNALSVYDVFFDRCKDEIEERLIELAK